MAKRYTRKLSRLLTKREVKRTMADYAALEAKREALQETYKEELARLKERFEPRIDEISERMEEEADKLQYYAETHYARFKEHRTMVTEAGNIGFRICPPKVKIQEGFSAAEVLEKLDEVKPEWIVIKKSLNKEQILKARNEEDTMGLLHRLGLDIVQDESFFIEPKLPDESGENSDAA